MSGRPLRRLDDRKVTLGGRSARPRSVSVERRCAQRGNGRNVEAAVQRKGRMMSATSHASAGSKFVVIGRAGHGPLRRSPRHPDRRGQAASSRRLGGSSANIAVALGAARLPTLRPCDLRLRRRRRPLLPDAAGPLWRRPHATCARCRARRAIRSRSSRHGSRTANRSSTATGPPISRWTLADVEARRLCRAIRPLITTGTVLAAEPSRSAAFRAFQLARAAGLPLIFDIDYRPYSWPSHRGGRRGLCRAPARCCDIIVGQ